MQTKDTANDPFNSPKITGFSGKLYNVFIYLIYFCILKEMVTSHAHAHDHAKEPFNQRKPFKKGKFFLVIC